MVEEPAYYGFHSLRHFMASFLADKMKASKKTVSDLLRHKSLATTEIYLHSIGESQREAMAGIEGIFAQKTEKRQPETATTSS